MFPTFHELRPVFDHMFNHGLVKIFMTNLCANSACNIPGIPSATCDAASIEIHSVQTLADCYLLESNGNARIKELTMKTPSYKFCVNYSRGCAILKTRSTGIVTVYRHLVQQVPGLTLRVVMPAQN
jgi:hypothetical protein